MRIGVLAVLLVARVAAADDRVAVDGALEVGVLLATHGKLTASYAHHFWEDGAYVEARLGAGTTGELLVSEERLGAGLVFHPRRHVDLTLGWRVGHSRFSGMLGDAHLAVNLVAIELAVGVAIEVAPGWRVRALPLGPTLYWNRTYAGTIGFELGVERAF